MQSVTVAPSFHGSTGKLINNHHLAVIDDIIDIALEEDMRLQGLVEVMQELDIGRIIQVFDF